MSKKIITVALAGNPNSGKTSIFNNLTGLRQNVGNYPGVTVEKKEGSFDYKDYAISVIDLPGTYSLSAYSEDELVARNFIIYEKPDIVVNIIDSSNLERNLYLTTQLLELEVPMILAMNMTDVIQSKGCVINYEELSKELSSPVVATIGTQSHGAQELLDRIVTYYEEWHTLRHKVHVDYGAEIFDEVRHLEELLRNTTNAEKSFPLRWLALKVLEQDPVVLEHLKESGNIDEILKQKDEGRNHLRAHFSEAPEILMADRRYGFISGLVKSVRKQVIDRIDTSDSIDKIVLNRYLGFPIFAGIMYAIFKFTFSLSAPFVGWLQTFFGWASGLVMTHLPDTLFRSFIVDGFIAGVGSLVGFLPLIMLMFLAIAFFEDSGYMSRAAFLLDKFMSRFGLHGKSFLPLMISTNGCAALGVLASRTLENPKDRLITMLVAPFMICGAKLPIFAIFIAAFFPLKYSAMIMFFLYFFSIFVALLSALILRHLVFKGEVEHFVMELPPYRMPSLKGVLLKMWERGWVYLKKAGTVIFAIAVIIWGGFTFPQLDGATSKAEQMEYSIAGRFSHAIEPLLKPIGLDWRAGVALVGGVAAKEVVVSTFGTIYSLQDKGDQDQSLKEQLQHDPFWNPLKALAFLIFCLLYAPCFVVSAVFFKESRSFGWTTFLIVGTTSLAWLTSFIIYQGGLLLGLGV